MKSTKRSLFASVLALILCVCMLLGTTWAWFTDEVQSGVNQIVAGNLDIEVTHTNATDTNEPVGLTTTLFDKVALWEPGAVEYENITVKNVGNLAAKVKLNVADVAKNATTVGNYDLTQVIKVVVKDGGFDSGVTRDSIIGLVGATGVETFAFKNFSEAFSLDAKDASKTYGIALYWQPTDNDNLYNLNNGKTSSDGQPLWINFGLNVVATQNTVELDSFDNQYDAQATFPVLAAVVNETESYSGNFAQNKNVSGGDASSTQVTAKENIKLPSDASVTLIPAGTTLFKAEGNNDVAITSSNDNENGFEGSIVSNIKTKESTAASVTYQIKYDYVEGSTTTSVSKFSNIVTNVFDISTGLKNVKVSTVHNGGAATPLNEVKTKPANPTDKSFYYDSVYGKLYIYSSEYSDFKVTYDYDFVAAVAGQGYATFEGAIVAAQANDTVTLLKDITISKRTEINNKTITLNANGKTVNYTTAGDRNLENEGLIRVLGGSNVTVTGNGNFTYTGETWVAGYCFMVYGNSTLTIENGTFKARGSIVQAGNSSGMGTVIIKDGDFTTDEKYEGKLWTLNKRDNTGSVIEVYGGTFHGFDPSNGHTENPNDNFVAEGYIAKNNGDVWTVKQAASGSVTITGKENKVFSVGEQQFVFNGSSQNMVVDGSELVFTLKEIGGSKPGALFVTTASGTQYYDVTFTGMMVANDENDPNFNLIAVGTSGNDKVDFVSGGLLVCAYGWGITVPVDGVEYSGIGPMAIYYVPSNVN